MKILLFSDGTGNSSAKLFRTNVWRLYDALDLTGDQIAFYDNGVGTASFKPLALLGGAFGWGLKRNVLDLYAFLCRNYHKSNGPHHIYAFGFSRGAFTIRVLLGLIRTEGLVPYEHDERELRRMARWAYRAHRGRSNTTGGLVGPLRTLRNGVVRWFERGQRGRAYDAVEKIKDVEIEFVGLWDTVAAYGLPTAELTQGWDEWVWPLSLQTRNLYAGVKHACHALALDDERQTFHPLLWDESEERTVFRKGKAPGDPEEHSKRISDERVSQVWFAGMHSNVGGGYPDDGMAYDPLCWITERATSLTSPVVLKPGVLDGWRRCCTTSSPMADSRQGTASYYRYLPRLVEKLTHDRENHVEVPRAKIHHSVFARREDNTTGYAPIVLPERYAIVLPSGDIQDPPSPAAEPHCDARVRRERQEIVWDLVWLRRVSYFLTVACTCLLAVQPVWPRHGEAPILAWSLPTFSGLIGIAGALLPSMLAPVVEYFKHYPVQLLVFGGLVLACMQVSKSLQDKIDDVMLGIWTGNQPCASRVLGAVRRLRTSDWYMGLTHWIRYQAAPTVSGVVMLAVILGGGAIALVRTVFDLPMLAGHVCRVSGHARAVGPAWEPVATFETNQPCQPMGVALAAGKKYEIQIAASDWLDDTLPVSTLEGFPTHNMTYAVGLPFRRHLRLNWFVPIARVGPDGDEYYSLAGDRLENTITITPQRNGELFLYVNDVIPLGETSSFYANNHGTATVRIREVN